MIFRIQLQNIHREILSIDMSDVILINRHTEKENIYIHFTDNHMQALHYTWEENDVLNDDLHRLQLLHKLSDMNKNFLSEFNYFIGYIDPLVSVEDIEKMIDNFVAHATQIYNN